jgi:hypothetical protein
MHLIPPSYHTHPMTLHTNATLWMCATSGVACLDHVCAHAYCAATPFRKHTDLPELVDTSTPRLWLLTPAGSPQLAVGTCKGQHSTGGVRLREGYGAGGKAKPGILNGGW